jgi:hypothetical protein
MLRACQRRKNIQCRTRERVVEKSVRTARQTGAFERQTRLAFRHHRRGISFHRSFDRRSSSILSQCKPAPRPRRLPHLHHSIDTRRQMESLRPDETTIDRGRSTLRAYKFVGKTRLVSCLLKGVSFNKDLIRTDSPDCGHIVEKVNRMDSHPSGTRFALRKSDLRKGIGRLPCEQLIDILVDIPFCGRYFS